LETEEKVHFLVAFPPLERRLKFVAVDAEMNGYKNK
jgi:hypothetical protein